MLTMGQGTADSFLVMFSFRIQEGLWPVIFQRSKPRCFEPTASIKALCYVTLHHPCLFSPLVLNNKILISFFSMNSETFYMLNKLKQAKLTMFNLKWGPTHASRSYLAQCSSFQLQCRPVSQCWRLLAEGDDSPTSLHHQPQSRTFHNLIKKMSER